MAADTVSRELKSLQDELATTKMKRGETLDAAATPSPPRVARTPSQADTEQEQDQSEGYLRQLANELTELLGEAEKSVTAHPAQSLAGALLVGILIGRLLTRR
jgi:ElaB/YqjD/DUF883 family membrane-anchored ribosome-binding protein